MSFESHCPPTLKRWFRILALALVLTSCEKEINIKLKDGEGKLVVEGHIEPGLPPYIVLTRSQPYFSSLSTNDFSRFFVHNALVNVSDGRDTIQLREISSDTLPPALLKILSGQLGIKLAGKNDPDGLKLYIYFPADGLLTGEAEKTYTLHVEAAGEQLHAVTTIPRRSILDSLWVTPHPSNDTLATLYVRYSDPAGERNYIRYFTSTDGGPFYPPFFQSVLDDKSIFDVDGKTFDFPVEKGHNRNQKVNLDIFTYFTKGDSVALRWCAIDQAHFAFWNTAEFDRGSTGNPFASPTRIKSNVVGGLGIWGGYNPSYYYIKIPAR
jgi:hypothetical protein